ncbi:hypothetical protein PIB30_075219 [Stylosanthes scabra]|uniref:Putative plant transposon protein domain-containing protein n=1 Tax=Stylosanthes scabra TaxID=79078 RepID=A0ABU6XMV6_9FABA|nr:hypothetical protein [Stylosanthes scabra]
MASSSASYDANQFKSAFHQSLFEDYAAAKAVTSEISFDLAEDEHPEIREQVANRGWRRLTNPRTQMSKLLIQEFYANATRTGDQLHSTDPYKSYVRGVDVDFSAENIKEVLRIRENTPGTETNFITRQTSDHRLDEVLQELCVPGARWKLSTSTPVQPIQLKRQDLFPLARGGEEVRAEELIADNIAIIAQGLDGKGNLAFPSTIYRLCKAAGVSMREFRGTELTSVGKPITVRMMARTRGRNVNLQPNQPVEEEDQSEPMHQDWAEDEQHHDHEQPHYETHDLGFQSSYREEQQQGFRSINEEFQI